MLKVRTKEPTLTQYKLIDINVAPSSYERVMERTASSYAETTVTTSGLTKDSSYDGVNGKAKYTYSASAGSGYVKSTCSTSGIPDCGNGSAKFVIKPNGANSILVYAYKESTGEATTQYWSGYVGSATINYIVSTPPSGDASGYIIVNGTPLHTMKAIQPATVVEHNYDFTLGYKQLSIKTPTQQSITVLAKTGTAAVQTFAFDIDDSDLYD